MATNLCNQTHTKEIDLEIVADWHWGDVQPSRDPDAQSFCDPVLSWKPVLYIPAKRANGKTTFPNFHIRIEIQEKRRNRTNFKVPACSGREISIEIRNRFDPSSAKSGSVKLTGRLNEDLTCDMRIPPATIEKWLDPAGPLKARVNENLLDFRVTCDSIRLDGRPLEGESSNRVYIYRRKVIAFLPGVFGSQFDVRTSDGKVDAFPNFVSSSHWPLKQEVGLLECDSEGVPLLEAHDVSLLRLGGRVYDLSAIWRARTGHFVAVPEEFMLYQLHLCSYDWRGDLTSTAEVIREKLEKLQVALRKKSDYDDEIAVAGHSTGGLLLRRLLAEPTMENVISHAFFLNVPFRGAPKALSVLLTGCDPPGGGSMIPFISESSLRNIAVAAPIVYHLAPSPEYPEPVVTLPDGPAVGGREAEKEAIVEQATRAGVYSERKVIQAARATAQPIRTRLAEGANDWAEYWDEYSDWERARDAYAAAFPGGCPAFENWPAAELREKGLANQDAQRARFGWSRELARKAREFHAASERAAASGKWKEKAFIFYSRIPDSTTGRVVLAKTEEIECDNTIQLMRPFTVRELWKGEARPESRKNDDESREYDQWIVVREPYRGSRYIRRRWKLSAEKTDGDCTVPLVSLRGFGGPAKIFKALPGNPNHVDAAGSDWLWQRVVDVLQGYGVDKHLEQK